MSLTPLHRAQLKKSGCTPEEIEGIAAGYSSSLEGDVLSEAEMSKHLHTLMLKKYAKNPILA